MFKGGITSRDYIGTISNWFYYGFKRRFQLSYKRIYGSSRQLPRGWEKNNRKITHRVGKAQTPVIRYRVFITDSHNGDFCNFDHIPVYMDLVSNFTWGKNNSGGRQIGTEKIEDLLHCAVVMHKG